MRKKGLAGDPLLTVHEVVSQSGTCPQADKWVVLPLPGIPTNPTVISMKDVPPQGEEQCLPRQREMPLKPQGSTLRV